MTTIFKTMLLSSLRDKITLFYSAVLPIALLMGLGFYFNTEEYIPRLLIGVISLSSLFWGISGIAFQVHGQRNRGVYRLIKLTPYSILHFILIVTTARTRY